MRATVRAVAWAVLLVGAVGFLVVAARLVPWDPVPGGAVHAVSASSVFTSEQIERAEEFSRQARLLGWSSLGVSLVVASVLGFTRLGPALMRRVPGPWWIRAVLGSGAVLLVGRLATLPLALALRRERFDAGLTQQSVGGYLRDLAVSFGLNWLVSVIVLLVLIGCARRWSRAWPAVAGSVLAALVMIASFIYPVLVEPLFNHFESLPEGNLRTAVLALADQEGVHVDDVLVADASRRTTTLNAYVSGYGDTRRVVLYDNLVNDLPRAETLSVVAHELAHARHNDPLVGSVLGALGTFASIGLLALLLEARGTRRRFGLDPDSGPSMAHVAVVPLVLALSAWGTLLTSPVQNTISRQVETRADVDALRVTQDPDAFIAVQKQLAVRSLNDPTPPKLSQFWFGSHPTTLQRVAIAEQLGGTAQQTVP